jgi:hypothetical protein
MKPNFNIELLPEAVDFLENLDNNEEIIPMLAIMNGK